MQVRAGLGKAGQIGGDLYKGAVFLNAPHNAHHGLAYGEPGGVLLQVPSSSRMLSTNRPCTSRL